MDDHLFCEKLVGVPQFRETTVYQRDCVENCWVSRIPLIGDRWRYPDSGVAESAWLEDPVQAVGDQHAIQIGVQGVQIGGVDPLDDVSG